MIKGGFITYGGGAFAFCGAGDGIGWLMGAGGCCCARFLVFDLVCVAFTCSFVFSSRTWFSC